MMCVPARIRYRRLSLRLLEPHKLKVDIFSPLRSCTAQCKEMIVSCELYTNQSPLERVPQRKDVHGWCAYYGRSIIFTCQEALNTDGSWRAQVDSKLDLIFWHPFCMLLIAITCSIFYTLLNCGVDLLAQSRVRKASLTNSAMGSVARISNK